MLQKKLRQIDAETGELLEGVIAFVHPKRKNAFTNGWIAMGQAQLRELAIAQSQRRITGADRMVLDMLLSIVNSENWLAVSQADLANELGMPRQNVHRSIQKLIAEGVLCDGPRVGSQRSYRLSPAYGWKGSARAHVHALDEYRKQKVKE